MHRAFTEVEQRPFPLPSFPWVMTQEWEHLLMIHWPVTASLLKKQIPEQLELDTFEKTAWISYVLFQVNDAKIRSLPKIPYLHSFIELNVRTYVTYKGKPGVYFFSLDANKRPIVFAAKIGALLPYRFADIAFHQENSGFCFKTKRKHSDRLKDNFESYYRSTSDPFFPSPHSLDYWLLERYCFWTTKGKWVFRGDIHHDKWKVTTAKAKIVENTMASFLPRSSFQTKPLLHYTSNKKVFAWPIKHVK
ncbi:DUF2071 domain-containing protein [Pueribacillus theae]|uniref:DUF2071 domain-containing protein n=1 Tax=Pueribacillus theae TaxID=2171751 RepID=A0A2U1JRU3_9BACI|nr:DUF2071 domain-containing protein [Pueribacillus theae]PWA07930.1 DUF2071 domain-containing protein [Pueribacillus theae]